MTYILIVEDNLDNAEILSIYLQSQDLPIKHLSSGHNVLNLIMLQPPALIFMDVKLPDNDGRVLCRMIKTRLGDTAPPIIVMTAEGKSYKHAALALGADDFISKPFSLSQILEKLELFMTPLEMGKSADMSNLSANKG